MSKIRGTKLTHPDSGLVLNVITLGPSQKIIDSVSSKLINHPSVQKYLKGTKYRMLSFELVEKDSENNFKVKTTSRLPDAPSLYRVTFYDYTNNRTVIVNGDFNKRGLTILESSMQPLPSIEEFDEAVKILVEDPNIGPAIHNNTLQPYRPMPPLIREELPDGRVERTIAIGLLPKHKEDNRVRHEIVGVNMIQRTVRRFQDKRAPDASMANSVTCGLPNAFQPIARGVPGQVRVTVYQGGTVLWTFIAVRPAASSGTNGSGVELRYVNYRGKRALYRAHAPILNVKYDLDACGPYRDWQNWEGMIQADGTDVGTSGFRLCPTPAQTILDTGTDTGNFLGVAIYVTGQEVVLVSEMEAGWYRYISEWRLNANGTIRPRFGFSAVNSSCVCKTHHHHVYWRFDFDIRTPGNNVVREYNNPPLFPPSNWHTKRYEIRRLRDSTRNRKWQIKNVSTGEGYTLTPGSNDGLADSFARGDLWILRYRGTELDDGVVATGPPYEADLDTFVNGELIENQDVVIWYAAHFTHVTSTGTTGHIVGPDLTPFGW
jgi:hypothetical protein